MVLSAPPERWPSGRWRTPGKCVGGEPSRGFESLSLASISPAGPSSRRNSAPTPFAQRRVYAAALPGAGSACCPRSSSASRYAGAELLAGRGRPRAARPAHQVARRASSASAKRGSASAMASGDARGAAGPNQLDELRAPAARAAPTRGSAARRRARGRARGRPGCASAWAGWRWRRARGVPPSRFRRTPRSVARAATRARSYWLRPTRISVFLDHRHIGVGGGVRAADERVDGVVLGSVLLGRALHR